MRIEISMKSILLVILGIVVLFFINKSFAAETAKINVETANLRETTSSDSKILEQLSLGDKVEILEKNEDWYKVKTKGITGYIRKDLIDTNKDNNSDNSDNTEKDNTTEQSNDSNEKENTTVQNTTQSDDNQIGTQKLVAEDIKLKIIPTINATDIIELKKDEKVTVIETINNWVCVETTVAKGWIRSEKLKAIEDKQEEQTEQTEEQPAQEEAKETVLKTLFTNAETVNLRKEASTSSEIVTTLPLNMAVDVYEESNGWSKVKVSGKEGYISSALLSDKKQETSRGTQTSRNKTELATNATNASSNTTSETPATTSGSGSSVVSTAKNYIGKSYSYGASGPNSFDCSGFTSYIYKQYGVNLNRTAAGQYSNGTAVSRSNLQPGDLVMFGSSASSINHVGIYIGGGQIVHAANKSRGVTTDTINSGYYNNNYVGARRVIN